MVILMTSWELYLTSSLGLFSLLFRKFFPLFSTDSFVFFQDFLIWILLEDTVCCSEMKSKQDKWEYAYIFECVWETSTPYMKFAFCLLATDWSISKVFTCKVSWEKTGSNQVLICGRESPDLFKNSPTSLSYTHHGSSKTTLVTLIDREQSIFVS